MGSYNNTLNKVENYIFAGGVGYFAEYAPNGFLMFERDLGNLPGVTLTVASEIHKHSSSRSGIAKVDRSVTKSVDFSSKLDFEDFSAENLALFIAGAARTIAQGSSPVTAEILRNATGGREAQLGATPDNPSGVRGVTTVTVSLAASTLAITRVSTTPYAVGTLLKSSTNLFVVSTAGTTAASAPTFVTANIGDVTTDGTAELTFIGTTSALVGTTDYIVNPDSARIAIPESGAIAKAGAVMPAGFGLDLVVGYTPLANKRIQITSSGGGSVSGQFRFMSENADGENRDLLLPSCTLSASGDLPFITSGEYAKASFLLGVNERDTSTPQIIIDGRPIAG